MHIFDRCLMILGALTGLFGVILASFAAHITGAGSAMTAAQFLLFHAPVVILTGVMSALQASHRLTTRLSGVAIVIGLVLFSGELTLRALKGISMFANAAPAGGLILMCGWALLAIAALMKRRR